MEKKTVHQTTSWRRPGSKPKKRKFHGVRPHEANTSHASASAEKLKKSKDTSFDVHVDQTSRRGYRIKMSSAVLSKDPDDVLIGGIEGGSTQSTVIIMNGRGKQLVEHIGPETNHWCHGREETARRINEMINEAKKKCNISDDRSLNCLGLCLSGCEEEKTNDLLEDCLKTNYPNLSKKYIVGSDIVGAVNTTSDKTCIVLIAGTGSHGLLRNSDGKTTRCGGWGYRLGDEGSAYWIAHRACKYVFDDLDGLEPAPHSSDYVYQAMRDYFQIKDLNEFLPHAYENFDKKKIAQFARKLSIGCEKGDPLCVLIFQENGRYLAKHVNALARKAHGDSKLVPGGLKILCVGSVWNAWDFLKKGFIQEIENARVVDEITMMKLTVSAAMGACLWAADHIKCDTVEKNHDSYTKNVFHYKRDC